MIRNFRKLIGPISVLVLVMLVMTSCESIDDLETTNLGIYKGDQVFMLDWGPMSEIYKGKNYIELTDEGSGILCLGDDEMDLEWEVEEEKLTICVEDEKCTATLKDSILTINNFFDTDVAMTFVKEDFIPPEFEGFEEVAIGISYDEDFGKSHPHATGIVDFDTLKDGFRWLEKEISLEKGLPKPTYEEIMAKLGGVHGMKESPDIWKDDYHVYIWQTEDKKDFLFLSFKVNADGKETWCGTSWSSGLKN